MSETSVTPKCPMCGKQLSENPLKTWKFRVYKVGRYECPTASHGSISTKAETQRLQFLRANANEQIRQ